MNKPGILFFGHDFKFLNHVINQLVDESDFNISVIQHEGHTINDHHSLIKALINNEIIFCEWGLENLSWLSKNKFPDQKLIVRIHSQEFFTDYLDKTYWDGVDKIILVGEHMMSLFSDKFPAHSKKCQLIYNMVDANIFNLDKPGDALFNIGMLGVLPKTKSPHLGLELLKQLRVIDNRFKLHIKSQRPEEVKWLWSKEQEKSYYEDFYKEIDRLGLQDSVVWEGHGLDVPQWFQQIGFVFSPSEFEAFHLAIVEGMASGAIPIIRDWPGSDKLYPKDFIFSTIEDATKIIERYFQDSKLRSEEVFRVKEFATSNFGKNHILKQYNKLFSSISEAQSSDNKAKTLRHFCAELVVGAQQTDSSEHLNHFRQELDKLKNLLLRHEEREKDLINKVTHKDQKVLQLKKDVNKTSKELDSQKRINLSITKELETSNINLSDSKETIRVQLAKIEKLEKRLVNRVIEIFARKSQNT